MTHICVGKLTIIGSDNGLSPGRRQAIIWTNVGILLIAPLGTNFSEILSEIHSLSFRKMHLKMSSAKWRPFCLGLNVLNKSISSWNLSMLYKWTRPPEAWVMAPHLTKIYIGLTVGQFMTCHPCAPSHYRKQYWFIVNSTTCVHQAITRTNADLLSIQPNLSKIQTFELKECVWNCHFWIWIEGMHLKFSFSNL